MTTCLDMQCFRPMHQSKDLPHLQDQEGNTRKMLEYVTEEGNYKPVLIGYFHLLRIPSSFKDNEV